MRISDWSSDVCSSDLRYRASREELAQASRLGSIGQITAGVAHEINQPLAAIRSFAENSLAYLKRGDAAKAEGNLGTIIDLTARVGAITGELRNFARRAPTPLGPVAVQDVIDGRSEEHTSELQSLMRISYAVFCWNKKK